MDAAALHYLSTSIKHPEENYDKVDIAAIREDVDNGDPYAIDWCSGKKLLADPLTKDSLATTTLLLESTYYRKTRAAIGDENKPRALSHRYTPIPF